MYLHYLADLVNVSSALEGMGTRLSLQSEKKCQNNIILFLNQNDS